MGLALDPAWPISKTSADTPIHHLTPKVLWLFGEDHLATEVGTSNVFFVIDDKSTGVPELVTPPLDRGDILPGITRKSILELASGSGWGEGYENLTVSERDVSMKEIADAAAEGRLKEAFGAGTAAIVTPIACINYKGDDIQFPTGEGAGPITQRVFNDMMDIQFGRVDCPWSYKVGGGSEAMAASA
uniref:Branched-chain-amino-acid aminotransferase n=1 Tax=Phaeomonas parva TaxID=124430 RepID=A0A7S1XY40_9STRA|mmetsp:Transcript_43345/g.135772  ORF Transcript_43345/g.135772 Transcript_43345/m.135772 type:complete len:187 (+) Transcript_43345:440-1000(+)